MFRVITHLGVTPALRTEQIEVIKLTNIVALVPLIAYVFYVFYGIFFNQWFSIVLAGSMICLTVVALNFNRKLQYQKAKFTLFMLNSISIWITYQVFTVDYSVLTSYFPILFCFPLFFDFSTERRTIVITATFIVACIVSSFFLPRHLFYTIVLTQEDAEASNLFHLLISFALTLLVVFIISRNWNKTKLKLLSERKKAEDRLDELTKAEYQLIQSEKMASLGVMISGISHEMNNPLNFVKQSTESLRKLDEGEPDAQRLKKEYLRILDVGVRRLTDIVKSLNSFNHSTSEENKDHQLTAVIENCLSIIRNISHDELTIDVKLDDTLSIKGNEAQLHQIFLNLLTNALQAIEGSGTIEIKTERKNSNAFVSIKDNGKGIPKEIRSKIFDPFFTTKSPGEGVGLGLCIVQQFVKKHEGKVDVSSDTISGTEVRIILPLI